jgi:hypothetical protein
VSALLQDCEAAYASKEAYVFAGVETFRSLGGGNQFTSVFGGPPSGLVKAGSPYSQGSFDGAVAALSPGGGTPLADALTHADTDLVKAPFGDLPADERRYLAILTDGMRTSGSTIASIPAGGLGDTVVFAMGFGTGADVDYPTLDQLVSKGTVLLPNQVFHGESAGTIDKFYSSSLAAAIGYTPMVDPFLELFAGEHTHVDFYATSAEDSFFLTVQGMDFDDNNWSYHLVAPDGTVVYGHKGHGRDHGGCSGACSHCPPSVTARRSNGRLSLFLQRDESPLECWVGRWQLMVAYKAQDMARMLMLPLGSLLAPASAGPVLGPRYHRQRQRNGSRVAARLVSQPNRHGFDLMPPFTSGDRSDACNVAVNIYGRTRLKLNLFGKLDDGLLLQVEPQVAVGSISQVKAYGRLFSPRVDLAKLFEGGFDDRITRGASLRASKALKYDSHKILAKLEAKDPKRFTLVDRALAFKVQKDGSAALEAGRPEVSGVHHVGVMVEGVYHPEGMPAMDGHHGHGMQEGGGKAERFERVLTTTIAG